MRRFCTTAATVTIPPRKVLRQKHGNMKPLVKEYRDRNIELDTKAKDMGLDWRIIGAT